MVYKLFDKTSEGSGRPSSSASQIVNNKENIQLPDEFHKTIIRKFEKGKVYSSFRDNIWGIDLADMQLLSKINKGFRFSLYIIDIYNKHAWVVPLKDKKGVSIVNGFQKILDDYKKTNKIWVDKGSEFCNSSFKKWLKNNDIEMYSTNNEGKSVIAERFIKTLKNKIYKYRHQYQKCVY